MSRGILLGLNQNASNPFVMRGGNINNGTNAGVLNSNITNGNANNNNGFRAVLCPQHFDTQRRLKTSIPDGYFFKESTESVTSMLRQLDCIKEV